jgi:hypothetical protein
MTTNAVAPKWRMLDFLIFSFSSTGVAQIEITNVARIAGLLELT